jgi:hypothetical protein
MDTPPETGKLAGAQTNRFPPRYPSTHSSPGFGITGLYNWIDADRPLLSLRIGEQDTAAGFLQRYHTVSGGVHYLINRNVRLLGEARSDLEREKPRFTTGVTLAW